MSRNNGPNKKYGILPHKVSHHKHTSTSNDLMVCPKCREKENNDGVPLIKDYIKSINYINSCHNIINQMIQKNSDPPFMMPDLPNFLSIFTVLNTHKSAIPLSNMESLEEIYSRIESLDMDAKNADDTDNEKYGKEMYSSDDEPRIAQQHPRTSSIPRRIGSGKMNEKHEKVSTEKLEKQKPVIKKADPEFKRRSSSEKKLGEQIEKQQLRHTNSAVSTYKNGQVAKRNSKQNVVVKQSSQNSIKIMEKELDNYAKDLLGSCSETVSNSPLTSRSSSPKQKRSTISYKTKTEHCVKVPPPKINSKNQKSPKRRYMQPYQDEKEMVNVAVYTDERKCERAPTPVKKSPTPSCYNLQSSYAKDLNLHTTVKRVVIQSELTKEEKRQSIVPKQQPIAEWVESDDCLSDKNNLTNVDDYEDSDIEPDENQEILAFRKPIVKEKEVSAPIQIKIPVKPQAKYIVKQKPNDFFTKRRRQPQKVAEKIIEDESDVEQNNYHSESDIDDDIYVEDSKNKPSSTRILPKSILSNIGILTQTGKVKPEKEEELEKVKNERSSDKQNSSFRQPRNREDDDPYAEVLQITGSKGSSHSSDIKSDDEFEIATHRMDLPSTGSSYRVHH